MRYALISANFNFFKIFKGVAKKTIESLTGRIILSITNLNNPDPKLRAKLIHGVELKTLKGWKNQSPVEMALKEICKVHISYQNFASLSIEEVIQKINNF